MSLFVDVYCYKNGSTVSVSPGGRLHVGKKYVYLSFHPYLGPEFLTMKYEAFEPQDEAEEELMWSEFSKWHEKFKAHEAKLQRQGKSLYRRIDVK